MKIEMLGVYGGQLPGKRLTNFRVNDNILVDAGAATSTLDLEAQTGIDHILVSHVHLDHIKDIPFLADNVIGRRKRPIEVIGEPAVIEALQAHFLNNTIWPDFSSIPSSDAPVLRLRPEHEETVFEVAGLRVELVRSNHPVPTFAMFITEGESTLLYTADTGPTERIWERARDYPTLKAVILETSFPNAMQELSLLSGHLSPCHLPAELKKLRRDDLPIYLYHFKPAFEEQLNREVDALGDARIAPAIQGETITL